MNQRGFTVVELLIVATVSGLLMGLIAPFSLRLWQQSSQLQASQASLVSRLNSGDFLRDALDSSSGMINQNDLQDNNVGVVDSSNGTGKYWIPLHAVPQTITMPASGSKAAVFYLDRPSIDTSKNIVMNGTLPYNDDVVLYLDGSTKQLLARTLANGSAANNRAKTTCPKSSATTSCPADAVLADNVLSITTRYFSRSGNTIDYTSIVDPNTGNYIGPDFPSVEVVELTIKFSQKATVHNSKTNLNQTVIRVALRNA